MLGNSSALEILGGYSYSLADDLNGATTEKGNDVFWGLTVGLTFGNFGPGGREEPALEVPSPPVVVPPAEIEPEFEVDAVEEPPLEPVVVTSPEVEEEMLAPDPTDYYAEWNERPAGGSRKSTKNLWVYEKRTDKKRFSVTTTAGAKIQPYFDVPSPSDSNLFFFRVQGELVLSGVVRVWITNITAICIETVLGDLDGQRITEEILKLDLCGAPGKDTSTENHQTGQAIPIDGNATRMD